MCACERDVYCACLSGTCRCMPGACECSNAAEAIARARRTFEDKAYSARMRENEAKLRERGMGMFWKY